MIDKHFKRVLNDYVSTDSSGGSYPMMPRQNYLSKQERYLLNKTHKDSEGVYTLESYQRGLLSNYSADPSITDDIQRNAQTGRSNVMNLRTYGQPSKYEPFLNEVSLHDPTPDVRGSNNQPRFDQMALDLFKKTFWVKSNLFADDVGDGIQGPETRTDAELIDNRKQSDYEMKKRLIIFNNER